MGEILSIFALPRLRDHSPEKAPGFSSAMPSFSKSDFIGGSPAPRETIEIWRRSRVELTSSSPRDESVRLADKGLLDPPSALHSFSLPAIFAHQLHRFIENIRSGVERGPETDRLFAGAQRKHAEIEQTFPHFFARFRIRQIEGEEHTATADSLNKIEFALQSAKLIEEICAHF